jgi:hypothetical protein
LGVDGDAHCVVPCVVIVGKFLVTLLKVWLIWCVWLGG